MATIAKAYGQITIVDISDLGTLSAAPESNQPSSIIYDPNQISDTNTGYNPDWIKNNLILTPVIYYAGKELSPSGNGVTVTWQKRIGAEEKPKDVENSKGEIVENGKLIVTKNIMTEASPIITYICTVSYIEPQSGQTLVANGQISFSLTIQPTRIKTCSIVGETVFKYGADQTLVSSRMIKLEANAVNCSITGWQYKDGSGTFQNILRNGSPVTGKELVIDAVDNDSYFINRTATLKVITSESGVYDIHTITKLYDGIAGTSTLSVVISNEDIWIPCDQNGKPTDKAFSDVYTKITVYDGIEDVTSTATITVETSAVTGTWTRSEAKYTVTGLDADVGSVTFTVKQGERTAIKVFNLTKLRAGQDGESAVILRVFAPGGNIVNQDEEYVDLSYILTKGSESVTANSFTWAYYDFSTDGQGNVKGYQTIASGNTHYQIQSNGDLRVYRTGVDSYRSFRITVKYGVNGAEKEYEDYIAVQDKTDPVQAEIFSTLGDKIANGVGVGCVYARLFQNGVELDELQHLQVSIDQPSNPASLDIWAKINPDTKQIELFRYSNNTWVAYNWAPSHTYTWTFADYDGRTTNLDGVTKKTAKFLYVDGSLINRKMQFNLEVTANV